MAAVKANLAFFEAFGPDGIAALERLRGSVPADVPFVADAKRGDIGSTAARQAVALFDRLGADAITVNPYLGSEAIAPLLERADRFVYVLCRTSNPGAGELQDLVVEAADDAPAEPLYERVARRAGGWGPGGTVGLVVGRDCAGRRWPGSGPSRPGWRSSCPGSAPRAARSSRCSAHGPATAAAGRWIAAAAACSSTSRGGSPARRRRTPGSGDPADPGEALARPPATGPNASLCYCRRPPFRASRTVRSSTYRCPPPDRSSSSSSS